MLSKNFIQMRIDKDKTFQKKPSMNSFNLNANVNIKKRKTLSNMILSKSSRLFKKSQRLHFDDFIDLLSDKSAFSKNRSSTKKSNIDKNVEISLLSKSLHVTITFYAIISRLFSIFHRRFQNRQHFLNACTNSIRIDYNVYSKELMFCQNQTIKSRVSKIQKHKLNNIDQICERSFVSRYDILEFSFYENALSSR